MVGFQVNREGGGIAGAVLALGLAAAERLPGTRGRGAIYALLRLMMRTLRVMVAVVIVLLAVAIIIPNFLTPRAVSSMSACVANLKRIEEAKQQWALENNKKPADIPSETDIFGEGRPIRVKPGCPDGGTYILGALSEKPKCTVGPPAHTLDYDPKRFR